MGVVRPSLDRGNSPRPRKQSSTANAGPGASWHGSTAWTRPATEAGLGSRRRDRRGAPGPSSSGTTRAHPGRAQPGRPELSTDTWGSARTARAGCGRGRGRQVCGTGPMAGRQACRHPRGAPHAGQSRLDQTGHARAGSRRSRCEAAGYGEARRARRQGAMAGRWDMVRGVRAVDARTRPRKRRGLRPPAGLGAGSGVRPVELCGPVGPEGADGRNGRGERDCGSRAAEKGEQGEQERREHGRQPVRPPARVVRHGRPPGRDGRAGRPPPDSRRTHRSSPSGPLLRPFITYQQAGPR